MSDQLLSAIIGMLSAAATVGVGGAAALLLQRVKEERREKRAANEQLFHELYAPIYKFLGAGPPYFELDAEGLAMTLSGAKDILNRNLHLAPPELRERIWQWDEFIGFRMSDQLLGEVEWLSNHVWKTLGQLQKELKLA